METSYTAKILNHFILTNLNYTLSAKKKKIQKAKNTKQKSISLLLLSFL